MWYYFFKNGAYQILLVINAYSFYHIIKHISKLAIFFKQILGEKSIFNYDRYTMKSVITAKIRSNRNFILASLVLSLIRKKGTLS